MKEYYILYLSFVWNVLTVSYKDRSLYHGQGLKYFEYFSGVWFLHLYEHENLIGVSKKCPFNARFTSSWRKTVKMVFAPKIYHSKRHLNLTLAVTNSKSVNKVRTFPDLYLARHIIKFAPKPFILIKLTILCLLSNLV